MKIGNLVLLLSMCFALHSQTTTSGVDLADFVNKHGIFFQFKINNRLAQSNNGKVYLSEKFAKYCGSGIGFDLDIIKDDFYKEKVEWSGSSVDGLIHGAGTLTAATNSRVSGGCKWVISGTAHKGIFLGKTRVIFTMYKYGKLNYDVTLFLDHDGFYKNETEFNAYYSKLFSVIEEINKDMCNNGYNALWRHREYLVSAEADGKIVVELNETVSKCLSAKNIAYENKINYGVIGERYVPSITNERYSSETLFYYGDTPIRQNKTYNETQGGHSENRKGYTSVYRLTNENKYDVVVDMVLMGSSEYYNKIASTSGFWIFKENVHKIETNTKQFFVRKPVFLKAGDTHKDQFTIGEHFRSFNIYPVKCQRVGNDFSAKLEKVLGANIETRKQAKDVLPFLKMASSDPEFSSWSDQINSRIEIANTVIENQNRKDMERDVVSTVVLPKNFDPEFTNTVILSVKNTSQYHYRVLFDVISQGETSMELSPKETITKEYKITGLSGEQVKAGFKLKHISSKDRTLFVDNIVSETKKTETTKKRNIKK